MLSSGLFVIIASMMSGCAEDPYVAMMDRNLKQIQQMPDGPAKDAMLREGIADIDRERQTRAMEDSARAQRDMANSVPYVDPYPTPIQVQIVPTP